MARHANLAFFVPHLGCPHACVFCDQKSISGEEAMPTPAEVTSLCEQMLPQQGSRTEIAFFGGSFTAIDRAVMTALLQAAYPFVKSGRAAGIRISTRPDAIDAERLQLLRAYGVTAIELGAQSMDDAVLRKNGRGHTAGDVRRASVLIREAGFELGLQMMVGMYGEADAAAAAEHTAAELLALSPATVRIYPTVVVQGTALAQLWQSGRYSPLTAEQAVEICAPLMRRFREAGVRVIRVGLHSEQSLQQSLLAGPFHPAFGELCEGRIVRDALETLAGSCTELTVLCEPRMLSALQGHKKANVRYFAQKGVALTVKADASVTGFRPVCVK